MNRLSMMVLGMTLAPTLALAVAATDFTGSWVRDGANSDTVPNSMYWLTRGVDAGGARGPNTQVVIEVKQAAGTLQVADPQKPLRTYRLDGQPHAVDTDTGIQKATVTATAQGATVTINTAQPFGGMPGNATLNIRETWSLSPDGKVLTVATVRELPATRQSYKETYNRR